MIFQTIIKHFLPMANFSWPEEGSTIHLLVCVPAVSTRVDCQFEILWKWNDFVHNSIECSFHFEEVFNYLNFLIDPDLIHCGSLFTRMIMWQTIFIVYFYLEIKEKSYCPRWRWNYVEQAISQISSHYDVIILPNVYFALWSSLSSSPTYILMLI